MYLGRGNSTFSSLDSLFCYWQMELELAMREVAALSTQSGHYEWLRLLFGLKSAPLTFQIKIDNIFAGMLDNTVCAYLDDFIIASKDPKTHLKPLMWSFTDYKRLVSK